MHTALREGTIDETDIVHFVEVCYCLEGGLYPMTMEIPVLNKYFEDIIGVRDAQLREQCTMECEFCDGTRNVKLPGKSLVNELDIKGKGAEEDNNNNDRNDNDLIDIGRIRLNRKKQKEGLESLKNVSIDKGNDDDDDDKIKPVFAGAAISGLFAIFYDGDDYFRIKNIPDNEASRQLLNDAGFGDVDGTVWSMKMTARDSLAKNDRRSNVV